MTDYALRAQLPVFLVRNRSNDLAADTRNEDGTQATPASGRISILRDDGTEVQASAAVTIAGGQARFQVAAGTLPPAEPLSDLWQIRWSLTMPDGLDHVFIQSAHHVLFGVNSTVSPDDLTSRHQEASGLLAAGQTLGQFIEASFEAIQRRLLTNGRRPYLVLEPYVLHEPQLFLSLHMLFLDAHSSVGGDGKYLEMSEHYSEAYERAWSRLSFRYDVDEDGLPNDQRQSGEAVLYVGGGARSYWWA